MVHEAEPGEEEGEDRHLEGNRKGDQQLGREGQVLADANGRRDPDALILAKEEGIADGEDHRPTKVTTGDEKERRKDDERQRHAPLGFIEPRSDELPNLVKY